MNIMVEIKGPSGQMTCINVSHIMFCQTKGDGIMIYLSDGTSLELPTMTYDQLKATLKSSGEA